MFESTRYPICIVSPTERVIGVNMRDPRDALVSYMRFMRLRLRFRAGRGVIEWTREFATVIGRCRQKSRSASTMTRLTRNLIEVGQSDQCLLGIGLTIAQDRRALLQNTAARMCALIHRADLQEDIERVEREAGRDVSDKLANSQRRRLHAQLRPANRISIRACLRLQFRWLARAIDRSTKATP